MRKFLLLLPLFWAAVSGTVCAQAIQDIEPRFHFGLKLSPFMAWIKPDVDKIERDSRNFGFGYGVQTEFRIHRNYVIASGLQISYRGGKLYPQDNPPGKDSLKKFTLQYVEIPLTLKMLTSRFNKIRFYGEFGIAPGLNIRAKSDPVFQGDENIKDYIKPFNLNMVIGGGVEYTLSGSTVFFTEVEFNNGFLNIFDKDSDVLFDRKLKGVSNYLGMNFGILF